LSDSVHISFGIHGAGFLGDCIQAIQCAFNVSNRLGRKVGLYPVGMGHRGLGAGNCVVGVARELLQLFPAEGKVELITPDAYTTAKFKWRDYIDVPMFDPFLDEPPCEYVLVKQPWQPPHGLAGLTYDRICYQFYGRSNWRQQNFKKAEALSLYHMFPDYVDKVKLGQPLSITDSVNVMLSSDLFIGINSGMTLLARSVGIPTFVHPQRIPMDWFHMWNKIDSPSYVLFRSLDELRVRLRGTIALDC
jgi:hypothetical protein